MDSSFYQIILLYLSAMPPIIFFTVIFFTLAIFIIFSDIRIEREIMFCLRITPPTILLFSTMCLGFESIKLDSFIPFILQSIAAGISLIIGLSNRNASISERTRSKVAELSKSLNEYEYEEPKKNEGEESKKNKKLSKRECLIKQIQLFEDRFQLNQIALFIAWTSLFMGLIIAFILSYMKESDWISTRLSILIIGLLSYSFLITLWDIALGSKTLELELKYVYDKYHSKKQV